MTVENLSLVEKLDRHNARWRQLVTNPACVPTNMQIAEDAIKQIYRRYKTKAPSAVIWCDSPYQLAVIPALVTNVLDGNAAAQWTEFLRKVDEAGKRGSPEWEQAWENHWEIFKRDTFNRIASDIMTHPGLRAVEPKVRDVACERGEIELRKIARKNAIQPNTILSEKTRRNRHQMYYAAPVDFEFLKESIRLSQRIERSLGLSLSVMNMANWFSPFLGVWDTRLLKKLPLAETLLGPEPKVELPSRLKQQVAVVKEKCGDNEPLYVQRTVWWLNLVQEPRREPPLDIPQNADALRIVTSAITQGAMRNWERRKTEPSQPNIAGSFPLWLPHFLPWLPFALACRYLEPDPLANFSTEIDDWGYLARGALACLFTDQIAYLCKRPLEYRMNDGDQLHNASGPATTWEDGYESFAWKGITVDRALIMNPESITHSAITKELNAEIRRVMIDLYGDARYLRDAGAKKIHEDECGILYRTELPGDEPIVMVKVRNTTPEPDGTFKYYYLRVPPTTVRARQGVAWTFNVPEEDYNPSKES